MLKTFALYDPGEIYIFVTIVCSGLGCSSIKKSFPLTISYLVINSPQITPVWLCHWATRMCDPSNKSFYLLFGGVGEGLQSLRHVRQTLLKRRNDVRLQKEMERKLNILFAKRNILYNFIRSGKNVQIPFNETNKTKLWLSWHTNNQPTSELHKKGKDKAMFPQCIPFLVSKERTAANFPCFLAFSLPFCHIPKRVKVSTYPAPPNRYSNSKSYPRMKSIWIDRKSTEKLKRHCLTDETETLQFNTDLDLCITKTKTPKHYLATSKVSKQKLISL